MKSTTTSLLLILSALFISCGENTTEPIVSDIKSLSVDNQNLVIYSTDAPTPVGATVTYLDDASADATTDVKWFSDFEVLIYDNGEIWGGIENGGSSTLTAKHSDFNDSIEVEVLKLTSFYISSTDINTTGEHILMAKGSFEDNASDRKIFKNIHWSADNGADITIKNNIVTIDIEDGETNVTATMFGDINYSSPIAPRSIIFTIE